MTVRSEALSKTAEMSSLVTSETGVTCALAQQYQQPVGKRQLD